MGSSFAHFGDVRRRVSTDASSLPYAESFSTGYGSKSYACRIAIALAMTSSSDTFAAREPTGQPSPLKKRRRILVSLRLVPLLPQEPVSEAHCSVRRWLLTEKALRPRLPFRSKPTHRIARQYLGGGRGHNSLHRPAVLSSIGNTTSRVPTRTFCPMIRWMSRSTRKTRASGTSTIT